MKDWLVQGLKGPAQNGQIYSTSWGAKRVPGGEHGVATPPSGDKTLVILQAIQDSKAALETKIGDVGIDVAYLCQDLHQSVDRVTEAEVRRSQLEDAVWGMSSEVAGLSNNAKTLQEEAENFENRD
ncbi:hypothetical protein NDU88_003343 [Pleurodeles waltl]|uniref:Uncharacterized protein n=1 Tax=Pleurodeles waltl TaxID=8319 RepID=A0AAV7VHL6_PLEWA|nr:hypothetical protein NDU88_003343 [Pleurodeles waltl]